MTKEELNIVQANAEPDLQQTGRRLKAVVAGLIEGIMQLVVDPLALSQVTLLLPSALDSAIFFSLTCQMQLVMESPAISPLLLLFVLSSLLFFYLLSGMQLVLEP